MPLPIIAQDLGAIAQLARDGAPGLALKLLDNAQPKAEENIQGWLFFERQRIDILRDWAQWDALSERLQKLPQNVPEDFRHWANVEGVNAYLNSGRATAARELLRRLIWKTEGASSVEQFSLYRRLIVRSYLVENNLEDAQRAMRRYQQDYGDKGREWQKLRARVLLQLERPAEALKALQGIDEADYETMALQWLAELRSQSRPPKDILGNVRKAVEDKGSTPQDESRLWSVGAEAARDFGGRLTETRILETVLMSPGALPADDALFAVSGDRLWVAYRQFALDEGNALQLLIGQDARWLDEAAKWTKKEPEKARALLTVVMLDGAVPENRQLAYTRFLESVKALPEPARLLQKLFLDTRTFPKPAAVPDQVRYLLVDDALSKNDMALATRLMSGFEGVPAGADPFEWGLRRARILVLGGNHAEGIAGLNKLLQANPRLDRTAWDRILQVVFDLQTVGRHEDAITLFKNILQRPLEPQLQREILYWQADSYKALHDFPRAAWLYLKSATLLDARGLDPWGQTARFQAAEVLAEAGLPEDARRIYEDLLKVTREPERRAAIKYKLQELWLR
ncbi:MAG TPA: tetratricopeptide repeat protein [Gammaproteobacteria bacterium]|nr:tetratricopeptide repeat protein [Gammaproteobacteria bacterium]